MKKIHWFTDTTILNTYAEGDSFEVAEKEIVKQVSRVLKLKKGEHIIIKGESFGYECEISEVSHNTLKVLVLQKNENASKHKTSLLFCIPKKDKFELILEKCTEIGITDFYPLISDRTIKTNINLERASKIIQEASEQAQRIDTPKLHAIQKLDDVLDELRPIVFDVDGEQWRHPVVGTCHPGFIPGSLNANTKIPGQARDDGSIYFLIGPEGGFSEKELQLFKEKDLKIYKLGDTVLKTETAAIVVSGLLLN